MRNEACPFKTYAQYQTVKDHSDDPIWDSCAKTENENFYGVGFCKESWECQGNRTCNIGKNATVGKCDGLSLCKAEKVDDCGTTGQWDGCVQWNIKTGLDVTHHVAKAISTYV